jgi:hypothetical protein
MNFVALSGIAKELYALVLECSMAIQLTTILRCQFVIAAQ